MLGVVQDITGRKRAEAALRDSEERLPPGTGCRRHRHLGLGHPQRPRHLVRAGLRVPRPEAGGVRRAAFEAFARIVHPDDAARVREAIAASSGTGRPTRSEFRVVWPSGEVRWLATNGKVYYGPDGTPLRMLGATHGRDRPQDRRGRARAAARQRAGGPRGGRAAEPDEGRVPRHPQPRAAHAAQRHPRLVAAAPHRRSSPRTDVAEGLETIERNARVQTAPDRGPAGHEPDHQRQGPARRAAGRPAGRGRGGRRDGPPRRRGQGHPPARRARPAGRRASPATPTGSSRWSGTCCPTPSSSRPAAGRCRCCWSGSNSHLEVSVTDTRRGHRPGLPAARVRPLPPGRRLHHPPPRRAGAGAGDRAATSSNCTAAASAPRAPAPARARPSSSRCR